MKTVGLFGTSHSYQIPGGAESQFRTAIENACLNLKARAIGEEFCAQELTNRNVDASISEQIAKQFSIRHRYCDLNDEGRERLRVRHENIIRSQGWLLGSEQERIEREVRVSPAIRERHWLNQILKMNCWPTLFVCGANHVSPFRKLLEANGITVQVIECDWEPRRMKQTGAQGEVSDLSELGCGRYGCRCGDSCGGCINQLMHHMWGNTGIG